MNRVVASQEAVAQPQVNIFDIIGSQQQQQQQHMTNGQLFPFNVHSNSFFSATPAFSEQDWMSMISNNATLQQPILEEEEDVLEQEPQQPIEQEDEQEPQQPIEDEQQSMEQEEEEEEDDDDTDKKAEEQLIVGQKQVEDEVQLIEEIQEYEQHQQSLDSIQEEPGQIEIPVEESVKEREDSDKGDSEYKPKDTAPKNKVGILCTFSGCGKILPTRAKFNRHCRTHTGFLCDHEGCGGQFSNRLALVAHKKTHSKARSYICTEYNCMRDFSTLSSLRRHERLFHSPV